MIQKSIYLKKREPEINSILEMYKERRRSAYKQLHEGIIEKEEFQGISEKIFQKTSVYRNELLVLNDEYEQIFREHVEIQAKIEKMRKVLKSEDFLKEFFEFFACQVRGLGMVQLCCYFYRFVLRVNMSIVFPI